MYVILTSKPGLYRTRIPDDAQLMESYEYHFYGRLKAIYDIAHLDRETRIQIVEDEPPHIVNTVPTKFLDRFDSVADARLELERLASFGSVRADLVRSDMPGQMR